MAGRPPDPDRKGTGYLIQFPDQGFMNNLDIIAKREGISRKALVMKFLREGMEQHLPGNPQTLLNSYAEGGVQTLNQLVGRLRQYFKQKGKTTRKEILKKLISEGVKGTDRVSTCNGLIHWLKNQGVEVS